eukprot:scaffold56154_cov66-Phaeocystis_antarctica.AAC.1
MPIAQRRAPRLQRLTEQRLGLVVLALGIQLHAERTHGGACVLAIRALGLHPCTQKLDAQRIAVLVHALAAAAVPVDPLGGAAAGARLNERPVVFIPPAQSARPLLRYHSGCECRRSASALRAVLRAGRAGVERPPKN